MTTSKTLLLLTLWATSTTTACLPGETWQAESCQHYVDCRASYDEQLQLPPDDTSAYDVDGACWEASQDQADACARFCENEVEQLGSVLADLDLDTSACEWRP